MLIVIVELLSAIILISLQALSSRMIACRIQPARSPNRYSLFMSNTPSSLSRWITPHFHLYKLTMYSCGQFHIKNNIVLISQWVCFQILRILRFPVRQIVIRIKVIHLELRNPPLECNLTDWLPTYIQGFVSSHNLGEISALPFRRDKEKVVQGLDHGESKQRFVLFVEDPHEQIHSMVFISWYWLVYRCSSHVQKQFLQKCRIREYCCSGPVYSRHTRRH